jgi:hypothetical protein
MKVINVGLEFYPRLANRNKHQGDGKNNAIEFRERYLQFLDDPKEWEDTRPVIALDFCDVKKIGPSFANEAFAYFIKYTTPEKLLSKISFFNLSRVQESIIKEELDTAQKR